MYQINYIAGCVDPDDTTCARDELAYPKAHALILLYHDSNNNHNHNHNHNHKNNNNDNDNDIGRRPRPPQDAPVRVIVIIIIIITTTTTTIILSLLSFNFFFSMDELFCSSSAASPHVGPAAIIIFTTLI